MRVHTRIVLNPLNVMSGSATRGPDDITMAILHGNRLTSFSFPAVSFKGHPTPAVIRGLIDVVGTRGAKQDEPSPSKGPRVTAQTGGVAERGKVGRDLAS